MKRPTAHLWFEPAHYNANAACMIPAGWRAVIGDKEGPAPYWGRTRLEAEAALRAEFPNIRILA